MSFFSVALHGYQGKSLPRMYKNARRSAIINGSGAIGWATLGCTAKASPITLLDGVLMGESVKDMLKNIKQMRIMKPEYDKLVERAKLINKINRQA